MEQILEKINKSALKFLVPLSENEMYQTIVEEARKLFGGEYGSIFLENDGKLVRVYANASFFHDVRIRSKGYTYTTYKTKIPYVIDVEKQKNFHAPIKNQGVKSIIHIPLSYKNESIGVLTIHSRKKQVLDKNALHLLKLYGSMASLAIRKMQLYSQTKTALELRDSFISLASHELRTPLTALNGYVQLLYSRMGKSQSTESKWIKELYTESTRLTKLIKELLEINRIKQGQLQFVLRECYFSEIITHAIKKFESEISEHVIKFTNSLNPDEDRIIGDADKLDQVVIHILNNAAKFSPNGSVVAVSLTSTKKDIILQIQDQGKGIDRENITKVFDGFYKGIDNHKEGMGLGLLLAKHIIQSHKGEIIVDSAKKQGTIVEVKLPKVRWADYGV
jgi:two-component system, OmpR family, sensor histidine kinase ResE